MNIVILKNEKKINQSFLVFIFETIHQENRKKPHSPIMGTEMTVSLNEQACLHQSSQNSNGH